MAPGMDCGEMNFVVVWGLFFLKFIHVYRERVRKRGREVEGEGDRENPKQSLHSAQSPMQRSIS